MFELIELTVGETIQMGDYLVTLLDIEGDAISVRIEGEEGDVLFEGDDEIVLAR